LGPQPHKEDEGRKKKKTTEKNRNCDLKLAKKSNNAPKRLIRRRKEY